MNGWDSELSDKTSGRKRGVMPAHADWLITVCHSNLGDMLHAVSSTHAVFFLANVCVCQTCLIEHVFLSQYVPPPPPPSIYQYISTQLSSQQVLQNVNIVESTHSFRKSMILSFSLSLTSKAYSPSLKIKRHVQTQAIVSHSFNFIS